MLRSGLGVGLGGLAPAAVEEVGGGGWRCSEAAGVPSTVGCRHAMPEGAE
jgi:hypothetical protein